MTGTSVGATKHAAQMLGISVEEYRAKVASDEDVEAVCSRCHHRREKRRGR